MHPRSEKSRLVVPLSCTNLKGEAWTYPLWQALFHLVSH